MFTGLLGGRIRKHPWQQPAFVLRSVLCTLHVEVTALLNSRQQISVDDREDNNYGANYLCGEKGVAWQFTTASTSTTPAVYSALSVCSREFFFSFPLSIYLTLIYVLSSKARNWSALPLWPPLAEGASLVWDWSQGADELTVKRLWSTVASREKIPMSWCSVDVQQSCMQPGTTDELRR